ncbi:alginate O-acetyltransferase AlgX-related protein [Hymenobacter daeguensis]
MSASNSDSRATAPTRTKRRLLRALFVLCLLPALQTALHMKIFRPPAAGFEAARRRPDFSWQALRAGTYQDSLEQYATQKLGFRFWLSRPRNQLRYNLFDQASTSEIVPGRQHQLFERGPLLGYLNRQRQVPETEIRERVQVLRAVQDSLARRGKLLVFAIAPAKPSFYAELLPDSCQPLGPPARNYRLYAHAMHAAGINLLDFSALFKAWKPSSPYPLFPPGGTHWSGYGMTRAADTLFRLMEQRGHFRLPTVRRTGLEISRQPRSTDDDLARVLNLVVAPAGPLAYPTLAFEAPRHGQTQPRLLLVGDSFGYSLFEFYPYLQHLFAPASHFWYYNQEVTYPQPSGPAPRVSDLNLREQLAAHDVVLLLFTEHNLVDFDHDFSRAALPVLQAGQ